MVMADTSIIIFLSTISLFAYGRKETPTYSTNRALDYVKGGDISQHIDVKNTFVTVPARQTNKCKIIVKRRSAYMFQQLLKKHKPRFVQFRITIQDKYHIYKLNKTSDVFQPGRWYWTYGLMSKSNQFPSWELRYGLYSFGLLDFKTSLGPKVFMKVYGKCNLTLGTVETSTLISKALIPLIEIDSTYHLPQEYKENYFCYSSVDENIHGTIAYMASIYILYPLIDMNYKCCLLQYNFTEGNFKNNCSKDIRPIRWTRVITFNIIFCILIIAFCPIPLFKFFAWLGENDKTDEMSLHYEMHDEEQWIFANGENPLTFFDVMSFRAIGLEKNWPVLCSRLRRLICLIFAPSVIYIELYMNSRGIGVWKEGDKISTKDFVDVGTPVGFVALLADASNRYKVFVPALGGPVGITALYFILGFLYQVLPKCLKSAVNNGLPDSDYIGEQMSTNCDEEGQYVSHRYIKSPLLFGANDIITLSQINIAPVHLEPGYRKGSTLMRCNFYMLFTKKFWRLVLLIQISRAYAIRDQMPMFVCLLGVVCIPLYISFCLLEILLCILYFGVPFFFFLVVMIRAAMKTIPDMREKYIACSYLFSFRFFRCFCHFILFMSVLLYAYCYYLLIVSSFRFVTKVITFCFVAVIMFPSVSFGNLFLLVVIVYYIVRQLKLFSYNYTSVLLSAVALSKKVNETQNHIAYFNGHLIISNVLLKELRGIEINGRLLDTSKNDIMSSNDECLIEMKLNDHSHGVPKKLFQLLIRKYRPIHKLVLSLIFRVSILIVWVLLFLIMAHNYSLIPEDQIADVLHVIFIIVVGALPKVIESDLLTHSNAPKDKIEKKCMEQTIVEYWTLRHTK